MYKRQGIPVTLCGETAGCPLEAAALVALGYRALSMSPAAIGAVKEEILRTDINQLSEYLAFLIKKSASDIRIRLKNFRVARRSVGGSGD